MNDDLFSAHFLLRKMQEDEMGKWLHAILHQAGESGIPRLGRSLGAPLKRPEGDLEKNAKLWYEQVEPSTLSIFWGEDDPAASAKENMYRIMSVKSGDLPRETQEKEEEHAGKVKWEEMVCVFKHLESSFGWGEVDGTTVYTRDEDPSHKSMVLGTLRSPLLLLQARALSPTIDAQQRSMLAIVSS